MEASAKPLLECHGLTVRFGGLLALNQLEIDVRHGEVLGLIGPNGSGKTTPEQVKGKRGDARSDIYTLGIMFYEMLTGKVPFTGPNPFVIMNERLLNNPIPPREANPEITPEQQEIIYRALERDPKKRYASAHEFALDLEHPEKVGVADRDELRNWKQRRSPMARRILFYIMLALIPVAVFALMLYAARQK